MRSLTPRRPLSATVAAAPDRHSRQTISKKWATPMSPRWQVASGTGGMKACRPSESIFIGSNYQSCELNRQGRQEKIGQTLILFLLGVLCVLGGCVTVFAGQDSQTTEPPPIPFGLDAITQWDRWPYLRIGVRCYMRSTFDRSGGNDNADAAHFIRQLDDTHNIVLDERGPGILWFARFNHWHGSPWQYLIDGREFVLSETSTADPVRPAKNSVFEPQSLFPPRLNYTWAATKGADLTWTPVPFESSLRIAYGHANYGTGYFILWNVLPGLENLSTPLKS